MSRQNVNRRGIALVWTALFLLILVGFVGLATDTAWVVLTNHELKNAADASALAAARLVRSDADAARTAAVDIGLLNVAGATFTNSGQNSTGTRSYLQLRRNDANAADGDIVFGRWNQQTNTFTAGGTGIPNAAKVVARRTAGSLGGSLPLVFGSYINNVHSSEPQQTSVAYITGGLGAGLLVLDPTGSCALNLSGNPTSAVLNGTVQVNSSSSQALCSNGNPAISADEINVVGNAAFGSNTTVNGNVNANMPPIPDPLAHLQEPPQGPLQPTPPQSGNANILPGWYPNGIRKTNGVVNASPGIYYLGGGSGGQDGLRINGGTFTCNGCMFYVKRGDVFINGNVNLNLSPITDESNAYWHVTIFQARDNNSAGEIQGGANSNLTGTLYFPNNSMTLTGGAPSWGVQVICWRIELQGNNTMILNYDGAFPGPLITRTFLVW